MAGDALGGGVEHEVDAVVERALHRGRGERRVDELVGPCDGGERVEVHERQRRVGRRLRQDDLGLAGPHRGGERGGVGAVDERDVDPEARQVEGEQRVGDGEHLAGGHDVVARGAQAEQHAGHRGHPRRGGQRRLRPLQLGDGLLELAHRRAAEPRVEPVGPRAGDHRRVLGDGVDLVGRAREEGRRQRARHRAAAGRDRGGLDVGDGIAVRHGGAPGRRGTR